VECAIRPATNADVGPTLKLWQEADAEPTRTDDEGSLRQLIDHDPASLLLADYGGVSSGPSLPHGTAGEDPFVALSSHPILVVKGLDASS
jgi:hypothetical protein